MLGLKPPEPPYVAQGRRAQELLDQGRAPEAVAALQAALDGLRGEVGYGRAVVLERLGRALLLAGDHEGTLPRLREALEAAGRLPPTETVRRLRRSARSTMGDALRAAGRPAEARRAYLAALEIGRELRDPRGEGVDQARLGALALEQGDAAEALERYRASLDALRRLQEPAVEAVAWEELGRAYRRLGDAGEAARHFREAVECERRAGASPRLVRRTLALAEALLALPDRRPDAREAALQALALAQQLRPASAEAWAAYGVLGEIQDRDDLRELARRAPVIAEAAERLGPAPTLGRAVTLGRLGRCFAAGGRPDLAAAHLREAVRVAEGLPDGDSAELLEMLRAELEDVLGTRAGQAAPEPGSSEAPIVEETATDYAFDPNLLLDGPRTRRLSPLPDELPAVAEAVAPMLVPGTRTWLAEDRIRFAPPPGEPVVRAVGACTVLRRTTREVALPGAAGTTWRLLAAMDGRTSWGEIRARLPEAERAEAERVLRTLVATDIADASGRPLGRFIHWATKKGVIPAGGLEGEEVLRLAARGQSGADDHPRIPLGRDVPERLRAFHALTRARRSTRDYGGGTLSRDELAALLATACGVTGAIRWPGGEVKLRAYPSSGALYSVGVYPVVLRVEGLEPAVHRYDAETHALEVVRPGLDPAQFVAASLPMEREMVRGAALMVCLTGCFPRHERKYGEGGYRMMVAEAGHVSHNLVLAGTALGLRARPFGGMFDRLVNEALGLDETREEFLLAVLVGR